MRFSIVVPVYNKSDTLSEAIDSILSQSYKDFEIVIVDDGSTDDLSNIIADYSRFDNIRFIRQKNAGVSVARNVGIQNSHGEFICFLDADDIYLNNHLEILNELIEKYPECSYFATSHITISPDNSEWRSSIYLKEKPQDFLCNNLFYLLNKNGDGIIHTNSMCIEKSIIQKENIYFEPNEKIGEDTDMWFRLALKYPIVISKNETTRYRREFSTATSKTSNSFTWKFARRLDDINAMVISPSIKKECSKLIDRYKMKCCRDYIVLSEKKSAQHLLKTVAYKSVKYYITWLLCLLPLNISKWIITHL